MITKTANELRAMNFRDNYAWQAGKLAQVINIVRDNLAHLVKIELAPQELDMEEATDLKLLVVEGGAMACRIRRPSCEERDLTLRTRVPGDYRTEWHKIRDGKAKWYFYGWTDNKGEIAEWILVDLDVMRENHLFDEIPAGREIPNRDGTFFTYFTLWELGLSNAFVAKHLKENNGILHWVREAVA